MKTEKLTRKEIIDNRLKDAGWNVNDRSQVVEEFNIVVDKDMVAEGLTPYAGKQFSDYVLLVENLYGSLSQRAFKGELKMNEATVDVNV